MREDEQTDALFGVSYLFRAATTLRLQVAYTDNKSNIVINQYDRTVVSLSSRFNF